MVVGGLNPCATLRMGGGKWVDPISPFAKVGMISAKAGLYKWKIKLV